MDAQRQIAATTNALRISTGGLCRGGLGLSQLSGETQVSGWNHRMAVVPHRDHGTVTDADEQPDEPADPRPLDPWGRALLAPDRLSRLDLRYFLSEVMASAPHRTWTPSELAAEVEAAGFRFVDRPGKVVSDHLRAEVNRGRVIRVERGRYRSGSIPGTTRRRMQYAVRHRRQALAAHRERGGQTSQTWSW